MSEPTPREFHTTRWSMVLRAAKEDEPGRRALAELCELYWYPLYAFLRRQGQDVDAAQDLTQGFFARLIEKQDLQRIDTERGRFRSYLLASLKHFAANEWDKARAQKRGGDTQILSLDFDSAEQRYRLEPGDTRTPESLFLRRWALTVLDTALQQLQEEARDRGRGEQFEKLKVFLEGDGSGPSYAELAPQLSMTEGTVRVAVHRLRQRFRELLRQEIGQTLEDPADVESELADLLAALR